MIQIEYTPQIHEWLRLKPDIKEKINDIRGVFGFPFFECQKALALSRGSVAWAIKILQANERGDRSAEELSQSSLVGAADMARDSRRPR